jgi:cytosine/adenosine deaminase-related metal-dependent hydrolase
MAWFRAETAQRKPLLHLARTAPPTKLVLDGRIVTMNATATVIPDGTICIDGDRIAYLGPRSKTVPTEFSGAPRINVNGTIYPGLIELHNHPSYNAIPLWDVPERFVNRKGWRGDKPNGVPPHPLYTRRVSNPSTLLTHDPSSDNARAVIRFVECRALLGGVTTTQGLTLYNIPAGTKAAYAGLVRNVELPDDPSWPTAEDQINDFTSVKEANDKYGPLRGDLQRPYIMHLSEGTDQSAHDVFEFLSQAAGNPPIAKNFIGVHATGLDKKQFDAMRTSGGIVWSPLSNFLLYGATTKVDAAVVAGVPIALGCDWGPSGTKNLLGELKIAKIVSDQMGGLFTDQDLVRMVTCTPAAMIGWNSFLGSLDVGKLADLLIIDGSGGDPYTTLIDATERNVIAVIIDGRPRVGRATLIDPTSAGVELIRIAQQDMVLDIIENPAHPLAKVKLSDAVSKLSYAMQHLPELASSFASHHELMSPSAGRFFIQLEMDEEYATALLAGVTAIGPGDVDRMELEPLTEVDDAGFRARLRANQNLPDWLRQRL